MNQSNKTEERCEHKPIPCNTGTCDGVEFVHYFHCETCGEALRPTPPPTKERCECGCHTSESSSEDMKKNGCDLCYSGSDYQPRHPTPPPKNDWRERTKEQRISILSACVRKIKTLEDLYQTPTLIKMVAEEVDTFIKQTIQSLLTDRIKRVEGLRNACPHIFVDKEYWCDCPMCVQAKNQNEIIDQAIKLLKENL